MMNSPDLSGLQPGQTGGSPNVRGVGQGFGNNPMSPILERKQVVQVLTAMFQFLQVLLVQEGLLEKQQFRVFKMLVV